MNNDILYAILCIIVLGVIGVVIFFWIRSSSKMLNIKTNPGYNGIYASSTINQRCTDGTGPNITPTIFIPGFAQPPPCETGYKCIKLQSDAVYGFCKAELGSTCNTIYDCAPFETPYGPTGLLGEVFCNGVCSVRISGNVLQGCEPSNQFFSCDESQNLVCNNVTKPPTNKCFNMYKKPCSDDMECLGGICTQGLDDDTAVCYCPGPDNPVNLKICMYLDGEKCKYDQECYGGICFHRPDGVSICQAKDLPGKYCSVDETLNNNCIDGYGCSFYDKDLGGICQPLIGAAPSQTPANTNQQSSLCTSYNVYSGYTPDGAPTGAFETLPILTCDPALPLVCNYNLTTRTPYSDQVIEYLYGLGTCLPPSIKMGNNCDNGSACAYPGVCIEDNTGQGVCSRPQFFEDDQSLTIVINNLTDYSILSAVSGNLTTLYPQIKTGGYDTLIVQLVGGGGGGNYGFIAAPIPTISGPVQVNYGGGGGGSGQIVGYIGLTGAYPVESTTDQYFHYQKTTESNITPKPYIIELESINWTDILLDIGLGGIGGGFSSIAPFIINATNGNSTFLKFYNSSAASYSKIIEATGGNAGSAAVLPYPILTLIPPSPTATDNGKGGDGYNGGGAGSGGKYDTAETLGGSGLLTIGGENGSNSKDSAKRIGLGGDGGNIGGGNGGGTKLNNRIGYSDGGGGGAGSSVVIKDSSGKIYDTGGNGASAGPTGVNLILTSPSGPGVDFTGGGGGGGAMFYLNNIPTIAANGSQGGIGYAILKFLKITKDVNYCGQQSNIVRVPASGSSGECAVGYTPNGLYKITKDTYNGPQYCIPNQYYTCNTSNFRSVSGTLCMNNLDTEASGICGNNYKLGIYIPQPTSIEAGNLTLFSLRNFFGSWHFSNLPAGVTVNSKSRLSVFQYADPSNPNYPRVRVILQPNTAALDSVVPPGNPAAVNNTLYFYYADFSVKDISPNNAIQLVNITVDWKLINVNPAGSTRTLFAVSDIKFTSGGNIAIIVNESAVLNYPFIPGNLGPPTTGIFNTNYNRIYLCNFTTDFNPTAGTLTYPLSFLGPIFCYTAGASVDGDFLSQSVGSIQGMFFNNLANTLPFGNFVWDLDDKYNSSLSIVFRNLFPTSTLTAYFYSCNYSGDFNTNVIDLIDIPNFVTYTINSSTGKIAGLPKSLKYYTDPASTLGKSYRYTWSSLNANYRNNQIGFFAGVGTNKYFNLEEITEEVGVDWVFNQSNNLASYKLYYMVTGDQYKLVNVNYDNNSGNTTTDELQLQGYVPTIVSTTTTQLNYRFLAMGNIDESMYTLIQTCE